MSWEMVGLVLRADLLPNHKLVMLGIANHTNADGKGCWAANERLEYYSGYSERQVQRIIQSLENLGYIKHVGYSRKGQGLGTKVWDIQASNIPMKPEYKQWQKEKQLAERMEKEKGDKMAPKEVEDDFENAQQEKGDIHNKIVSQMSPNPFLEPFNKNPSESLPEISQNGANGSVNGKILPANAGVVGMVTNVSEDPWEDAFTDAPVQKDYLSDDKDHEYSRGDPDGDDDPRDAHRARTPLEMKITQLTKSKYLTDAQRAKLSTPVSQSYGNQLPQDYPSPEDEWRANPKLFAEYVELCAKLIANGSGRNPSRSALITTMRNYARNKSGWLFFKNFKEEASAPARQVKKQYYHKDTTPSWRA
jgi:hypothetical protein